MTVGGTFFAFRASWHRAFPIQYWPPLFLNAGVPRYHRRGRSFYKWRDGGLLRVICPTCQNVFARSLMPATARLLCMGLFSIFWFATGRLGRNGRLVNSPEGRGRIASAIRVRGYSLTMDLIRSRGAEPVAGRREMPIRVCADLSPRERCRRTPAAASSQ
jgi:hypothetical protein